jgi:16S rRNA A1518/A1519 N6-dimethyltransferase RsmA/KsgA/DIM1 with predicted DNA glycosylase/AP lyase activity
MIQKEVGEKIKHDAIKKSFLWRLVNNQYQIRYRKTIPAKAFSPAPRVESCLVSCHPTSVKSLDHSRLVKFLDLIS